ncbi:MAG: CHASE2 domain-containing protein, partial [Spirulinaceae cyanobacterium]
MGLWSKLTLKHKIERLQGESWKVAGITIAVTSGVILIRLTGILQLLELAAYDQWMRLRSPAPIDDRIVLVGISETDLQAVGQWPITDDRLLDLLQKIDRQNPRAIGLDIYRDLPVEPGYAALADFMQSNEHLIGIRKVVGGSNENLVQPPPALAESGRVGANDLPLDVDGKIRRAFLYLNTDEGETVYSLGFQLAWLFLSPKGITPEMYDEEAEKIQLGEALFAPFGRFDGGYVWAADEGYQFILNYRGGDRRFKIVSLMDVLENRVDEDI